MDCVRCDRTDGFNRVVVNQLSRHEVGVLCADCEAEQFGDLLCDDAWLQEHGCAFCDGDGTFGLPRLECLVEYDDGTPRIVEYGELADTVHICADHLEHLSDPAADLDDRGRSDEGRHSVLEA